MRPFDKARIYFSMSIAQMTASSLEFSKEITTSISRFKRMDWGDTSSEDVLVNDDALKHIDRVLAVYNTSMGKIWIIAESVNGIDYNVITVLLPSEY